MMCKKVFSVSAICLCLLFSADSIGAVFELDDADLASFVDSMSDPGNSHIATDIAGDPGMQFDITYAAYTGEWTGYDMVEYTAANYGSWGVGDTWIIRIENLSDYYVWVKPYARGDDGDDSWGYIFGDEGYLDPGETQTFSIPITVSVVRGLAIQTDVPAWLVEDVPTNLPYAGDVISLQVLDIVVQCASEQEGDLNDDCVVDFKDFAKLAADWLKPGTWQ